MPKRSRHFYFDKATGTVVEARREVSSHRPRYPLAIETLAVHPDQIAEVREFDRSHGVPTEYRGDGSPIVTDSRHYKKYRQLHGAFFKNGYES